MCHSPLTRVWTAVFYIYICSFITFLQLLRGTGYMVPGPHNFWGAPVDQSAPAKFGTKSVTVTYSPNPGCVANLKLLPSMVAGISRGSPNFFYCPHLTYVTVSLLHWKSQNTNLALSSLLFCKRWTKWNNIVWTVKFFKSKFVSDKLIVSVQTVVPEHARTRSVTSTLVDDWDNNVPLQTVLDINDALLQLINIVDMTFIHSLLHDSPALIVNGVQVQAIERPQLRPDELKHLPL